MEDFPKYERICKENDIQSLFDQGTGFSCYPYRVVYLFKPVDDKPVTCRLLLSVSKKRFHHAYWGYILVSYSEKEKEYVINSPL